MPRSIRWGNFRYAFPVQFSAGLFAIFGCFLFIASSLSAQVTSTPSGKIFKTPGTATFSISVAAGTTLGSVSVLTLGAPNLDFTEVAGGTTCPNVTAGACTVEVQFQPTVAGRRQGSVLISDPTGKELLSISLDGAGTAPMAGFAPSIISTFAGGGTGGDSGPATSAKLAGPTGIAIDGFGNYYVVDQKANKVLKVTPSGTISIFAGTGTAGYSGDGGPAASAELNGPMDVVVDGGGDVYISDTNNNVVRKVNTAGTISTYGGQYYPAGGTPPPVCAAATNSVGDGCPGNQIDLNTPVGLVFCHAQNLHIADKLNNRVRTILRVSYNTITQVGDGVQGYNGDGENNTSAELNGPTGLDFDAANFIYVADTGNHIIRKTLLTGTTPNPIATVAGTPGAAGSTGDGGSAISAELNSPQGVRVDPAGDIYISDFSSNVVREVSAANGNISTIAGTGSAGYAGDGDAATAAQLNAPFNMFFDQQGNLYVADSQNGVIRKIDQFDAPSLSFTSTAVGAMSAAQDVTVRDLGDAPLSVTQITTPANFSLGGSDTSCTTSGSETLNPGATCILGLEFAPQSAGTLTGSMVLTDNSTPATQTIALTGAVGSGSGSASYTVTAKSSTVSMSPSSTGTATLNLSSTSYAGTVSFATSVTSMDGTPANVSATASPVTLASGGTATATVTITTNADAANRAPSTLWTSGGAATFCALMVGLPFTFRRKRTTTLLLFLVAISLAGSLMVACGGTSTPKMPSGGGRTYVVAVTPTGSGTVTNPPPVNITVTVK